MRAATNAAPDWSDAVACDISLVQDGGVENASGLAERAERNPGNAQESLILSSSLSCWSPRRLVTMLLKQ